MGSIRFDEYYLSEQDEPTVAMHLRGREVKSSRGRSSTVDERPARRVGTSIRRRLRVLRLAASLALAA